MHPQAPARIRGSACRRRLTTTALAADRRPDARRLRRRRQDQSLREVRADDADDRSARRHAATDGKRVHRCELLRNGAIRAKADEPPANTLKRRNRCGKPAPSGLGSKLRGVGDPRVRYRFDQYGIVKAGSAKVSRLLMTRGGQCSADVAPSENRSSCRAVMDHVSGARALFTSITKITMSLWKPARDVPRRWTRPSSRCNRTFLHDNSGEFRTRFPPPPTRTYELRPTNPSLKSLIRNDIACRD
jgi:hypothetical protein